MYNHVNRGSINECNTAPALSNGMKNMAEA